MRSVVPVVMRMVMVMRMIVVMVVIVPVERQRTLRPAAEQ